MLQHRRMTADGVRDHAGRVGDAVKAAELEIFRALTALLSMDSRSPVDVATVESVTDE